MLTLRLFSLTLALFAGVVIGAQTFSPETPKEIPEGYVFVVLEKADELSAPYAAFIPERLAPKSENDSKRRVTPISFYLKNGESIGISYQPNPSRELHTRYSQKLQQYMILDRDARFKTGDFAGGVFVPPENLKEERVKGRTVIQAYLYNKKRWLVLTYEGPAGDVSSRVEEIKTVLKSIKLSE